MKETSTSNFSFRYATLDDLSLLVDLRVEFSLSIHLHASEETVNLMRTSVRKYYERTLKSELYICILAYDGSTLAALGGMVIREQPGGIKNPSGRVGYIVNMYTRPEFRRRGLCRSLMQMIIDDGRKRGLTLFELHASDDGQKVYSQLGFELHPQPSYRLVVTSLLSENSKQTESGIHQLS